MEDHLEGEVDAPALTLDAPARALFAHGPVDDGDQIGRKSRFVSILDQQVAGEEQAALTPLEVTLDALEGSADGARVGRAFRRLGLFPGGDGVSDALSDLIPLCARQPRLFLAAGANADAGHRVEAQDEWSAKRLHGANVRRSPSVCHGGLRVKGQGPDPHRVSAAGRSGKAGTGNPRATRACLPRGARPREERVRELGLGRQGRSVTDRPGIVAGTHLG
jgi:hypothetical protein